MVTYDKLFSKMASYILRAIVMNDMSIFVHRSETLNS